MWGVILGRDIEGNSSGSKGRLLIIFILVMGWWKMAIFHFKHSYLNWRAIPYRRRMICVCAIFYHFLNIFFYSRLDLIEFSKCMTWQPIFLLFFFSFFMTHLLRTTTGAIKGLSDWRITSQYGDSFGKMAFRSKVVYIISVQREDYDSKVFLKMDNLVNMPQGINQRWFQSITVLRFVFLVIERILTSLKL